MATLTAVTPSVSGVSFSPVSAAAGGDRFLNTGGEVFYVKNAGGGSITVTVDAQSDGGVSYTDPTITVASGAEKVIGRFDPRKFNDSSGYVNISYSGVSSVTVAVISG